MLISILACLLGFHVITLERSTFTKIAILKNQDSVVLNPLVSLFGRLVARSGRVPDRRTDGRKDCNLRCACAPRVNYHMLSVQISVLNGQGVHE